MLGKKEMKQLVQDWLKGRQDAELIDFIEFKKDVETALYPAEYTKAGDVLLVYKVCTGELVCEPLVEMVGFILDKKEWEEIRRRAARKDISAVEYLRMLDQEIEEIIAELD